MIHIPGECESLGREKAVVVYEPSKIPTLKEIDRNMQNHSLYTYVDSKIVFRKTREYHKVRIKVRSVERELI